MAKPRAVAHAVAAKKRLPSLLNRKSLPASSNNNSNKVPVSKPKPEPPPVQMVDTTDAQQRQDKISDLTDPYELRQQQPPIPHVDSAQQSTASSLTQPSALSKLNKQLAVQNDAILQDAQERAKHVPLHSKLIFPQSPSTAKMTERQSRSPEKRRRSKRPDPNPTTTTTDTASVVFPTTKSVGSKTSSRGGNKLGFHAVKALLTRAVQGGSPSKRSQRSTASPIPGIPVVVANTVGEDQQQHTTTTNNNNTPASSSLFRDEPALEPPELTHTSYSSASPSPRASPQQQQQPIMRAPRPEPSPRKNAAASPQRAASPELLHRSDSPELREEQHRYYYHHPYHHPRGVDPDASVTSRGVVAEDPPVILVVPGADPSPRPVNVMGIPVDSDAVLQRMEQEDEQRISMSAKHTTPPKKTKSTNPFDSTSSSSSEYEPLKKRRERVTTNPFDETSSYDGDDDPFEAIIAPTTGGKVPPPPPPPPIVAGLNDDDEGGIPAPSTNNKKTPSSSKQHHRTTKRSKKLVGPLVERFEARANAANSKPTNATTAKKNQSKYKKLPNEIDLSDGSLISDLDQSLRHFPLKVVDPADIKPDLVSTLEVEEEDGALNTITTNEEDEENQQRIAIEVGAPPPQHGNNALADSITDTTILNGTPADIAMEVLSETCAMSPFSRLLDQDRKNRLSSLAISAIASNTGGAMQQIADKTPRISNEATASQRRKQIEIEDGGDTNTGTSPSSRGRESFSVLDQRHEVFFPQGSSTTVDNLGSDPHGAIGGDPQLTTSPVETDHLDRYSVGDAKTTKSLFQRIIGFGIKVHHMSPNERKQLDLKLDEMRDDVKTILDKSIQKADLEKQQQSGAETKQYPESLRQLDSSLRRDFRELRMNSILSMQTLLDDSEVDERPTKQLTSVFKKLRESKGSPSVSDHIDPETASDIIKQMHDFSASVKEAAKRSKAQAVDQGSSRPLWTQELVDLTGISTYEALEAEEAVWLFDVNPDAPVTELESIMEFAARRLGLPADGEKVSEIISPFAALHQEETQEKSVRSVNRSEENTKIPTIPQSFSKRTGKDGDKHTVVKADKHQDHAADQLEGRDEKRRKDVGHDSEVSSTDDLSVILKKIQRDVNADKQKEDKQQPKPASSTNPERRDFLDLIFEATETWLCGSKPGDVRGSSPTKMGSANNAWDGDDQEVSQTVSGNRTETESFESHSYSYLRGPKVPPPSARSSDTDVDPFDGLESPGRKSRSGGNRTISRLQGSDPKDGQKAETGESELNGPIVKSPGTDGSDIVEPSVSVFDLENPHDRRKAMDAPQTTNVSPDLNVMDPAKRDEPCRQEHESEIGVMSNDKGNLSGPKPEQILTAIVSRKSDVTEDNRQRPPLPERAERKLTMRSTPRSLLSARGKSRLQGWAAGTSPQNEPSTDVQSANVSPSKVVFQSNASTKHDHKLESHSLSKTEQDNIEAGPVARTISPTLRTAPKPDFEVHDFVVDQRSIGHPPPPAPESPLPPMPSNHLTSSQSSASDPPSSQPAINDSTEQIDPSEVIEEDATINQPSPLHLPEQHSIDRSDCASASTTSESARRVVQAYLDSVEDSLSKMTMKGADAIEQKSHKYPGYNLTEGPALSSGEAGEEITSELSNHGAIFKSVGGQQSEEHVRQVVIAEEYDDFAPFIGTVVEQGKSLREKGSDEETTMSDQNEKADQAEDRPLSSNENVKTTKGGQAKDKEKDEAFPPTETSNKTKREDHAKDENQTDGLFSSTESVDKTTMDYHVEDERNKDEPLSPNNEMESSGSSEPNSILCPEPSSVPYHQQDTVGLLIDAESYLSAGPKILEEHFQGSPRDVDQQRSQAVPEKNFNTQDGEKVISTGSDSHKPSMVEIPSLQNSTLDQVPSHEELTARRHSLNFDNIESRRQSYDQSERNQKHQMYFASNSNQQGATNLTSSSTSSSGAASVSLLNEPKFPMEHVNHTTNEDGSVIDLAASKSAEGMNPETPIVLDDFEPDIPQPNTSPESTDYPQISHGTPIVPALDVTENDIAFSLSPSTAASSPQKQLQGRRFSPKRDERSNYKEDFVSHNGLDPSKNDSSSSSYAGLPVVDETTETIPIEISIKSHETSIEPDTELERTSSTKPRNTAPVDDSPKGFKRSVLEKTLVMLDEEFSEAGESSASLLLALTRSGETESQVDDESENVSPKQRDAIATPGSSEHRSSADKARALLLKRRSAEFQTRALTKNSPSPTKVLSPLRRALMKHRDRRLSRETDSVSATPTAESATNTPRIATTRSFDSASPKSSVSGISPLRASLEKRLQLRNKLISGGPNASVELLDAEALYSRYSGVVEKSDGVIDVTDLSARDLSSQQDDGASSPSTMLNNSGNASFFPNSEDFPGTTIQTTKVISNVVQRLNIDQSDSDDETIRSSNTERKMGETSSWEAKSNGSTTSMDSIKAGLPKTRRVLDSVMDKLRLEEEKKESDAESTDMEDLFLRYDNIVKHLVVLDDERLARAQAKQMASIVHAADSAVLDDGKMTSSVRRPKSPIRALSEIASRIRKKSVSPRSFQFRRKKKDVSSADKVLAARFEERPQIVRSVSFGSAPLHNRSSGSVSSDGTHPSTQARHLRKQLEVALETSAQIRSSHAQLCEDLSSAQSRMHQRRSNNSIRGGSRSAPTSPYVVHNHQGSPFSGNSNRAKSFYHRHCAPSSPTDDTNNNVDSIADSNSSQQQHQHDYSFPKVILAPSSTTDDDDEEEIQNRHLESIRSGLRNSPRNSTVNSPRTTTSPRNSGSSPRGRLRRQ